MIAYAALLRAVNVGGRKLLMSDLKAIGTELQLGSPRTFIASGNLLFTSGRSEADLKSALEQALQRHLGMPVPAMVRSRTELAEAVAGNPFASEPGNRVAVIFLDAPPAKDALASARNIADERMALGKREIYVAYPHGMGSSKLLIPAAVTGTARNMNTVAKLADLARELE